MPLPGGLHQPFPSRSEDVTAVELQLEAQLPDDLLLPSGGLIVEPGGLLERDVEVFDLPGESLQQVVTIRGDQRATDSAYSW